MVYRFQQCLTQGLVNKIFSSDKKYSEERFVLLKGKLVCIEVLLRFHDFRSYQNTTSSINFED